MKKWKLIALVLAILIITIPLTLATFQEACNEKIKTTKDKNKGLKNVVNSLSTVATFLYLLYVTMTAIETTLTATSTVTDCTVCLSVGWWTPLEGFCTAWRNTYMSFEGFYAPFEKILCYVTEGWCGFCAQKYAAKEAEIAMAERERREYEKAQLEIENGENRIKLDRLEELNNKDPNTLTDEEKLEQAELSGQKDQLEKDVEKNTEEIGKLQDKIDTLDREIQEINDETATTTDQVDKDKELGDEKKEKDKEKDGGIIKKMTDRFKKSEEEMGFVSRSFATSASPTSNIYAAVACVSLVGVVVNLKKYVAISEAYVCCTKSACSDNTEGGVANMRVCERKFQENTCQYFTGGMINAVAGILIGLVKKYALSQVTGYIKDKVTETVTARWSAVLSCAFSLYQLHTVPATWDYVKDTYRLMQSSVDDADCGEFDSIEYSSKDRASFYFQESIYAGTGETQRNKNYDKQKQDYDKKYEAIEKSLKEESKNLKEGLTGDELKDKVLSELAVIGYEEPVEWEKKITEKFNQLNIQNTHEAQDRKDKLDSYLQKKRNEQIVAKAFDGMIAELLGVADDLVQDYIHEQCKVRHDEDLFGNECTGDGCLGCPDGYYCNGGYCLPAGDVEFCGDGYDNDCTGDLKGQTLEVMGSVTECGINRYGESDCCDSDGDGFYSVTMTCIEGACRDQNDDDDTIYPQGMEVCNEEDHDQDTNVNMKGGCVLTRNCEYNGSNIGYQECIAPFKSLVDGSYWSVCKPGRPDDCTPTYGNAIVTETIETDEEIADEEFHDQKYDEDEIIKRGKKEDRLTIR